MDGRRKWSLLSSPFDHYFGPSPTTSSYKSCILFIRGSELVQKANKSSCCFHIQGYCFNLKKKKSTTATKPTTIDWRYHYRTVISAQCGQTAKVVRRRQQKDPDSWQKTDRRRRGQVAVSDGRAKLSCQRWCQFLLPTRGPEYHSSSDIQMPCTWTAIRLCFNSCFTSKIEKPALQWALVECQPGGRHNYGSYCRDRASSRSQTLPSRCSWQGPMSEESNT